MDKDKNKKTSEIKAEKKSEVKGEVKKVKPKEKVVLVTSKRANCRFMPTNSSRVLRQQKLGDKLKLYREIKGKAILGSNVWYHTDKGYIHFSQSKIVVE